MHPHHPPQGQTTSQPNSKQHTQVNSGRRKPLLKLRLGPAANKFLLASEGLGEDYVEEGENWEEESPTNVVDQEERCPMILSHINDPSNPRYNNLAFLRIRNAASQLMQCHYDLGDYLVEVEHDLKQFCLEMAQGFEAMMEKVSRDMHYKIGKAEDFKAKEALKESQQMVNALTIENQGLQERIFDLQQKIVGVELQVDRRLKQRGRQAERHAAALARQENREIMIQLEEEVDHLKEKCLKLEWQAHPEGLRQRQYQIKEAEAQLSKQKEQFRKECAQFKTQKQAAYQHEHQLISGEENLARKIAQLRKKESELSEWQSELTRKSRKVPAGREVTLHSQLADDLSREQAIHSGEISLKSFARRPREEQVGVAATSLEQLAMQRKRNPNNQQQHQIPRDPLQIVRSRKQARQIGESSYARRDVAEQGRRFNPQLSYQISREASPYRALQDLKSRGDNQLSHQYLLPKNSSRQPRELSKNSRSSVSRSRPQRLVSQQGGLGSKLERLREEIKKQIESIK